MSFNCFMHERNIYKDRPDFGKIATEYPEFSIYAIPDKKGKFRVDFNDPNALRMLTRILLRKDFGLNVEIPEGYLIPTVPQRLNYILWIEDLLTVLPTEKETVSGIDIGTGPCAILSLLGSKKNGWHFLSTETADEAVLWAQKNIENNNLETHIKIAKVNKGTVLQDAMVGNEEKFDFCVCNPPFFENKDDIRKKTPKMKEKLEMFAKKEEIFAEGGEVSFVKQLLKDSLMLKDRISLYSSMFGKKKSFVEILKELQNVEGVTYTKTEFYQGNTVRWGIAWTFLKDINFGKIERPKPKKPKKFKPPLVLSITKRLKHDKILLFQEVFNDVKIILHDLQISKKVIKSEINYAEIEISANQNTWSHQRRKRRGQLKSNTCEIDNKTDLGNETNSCESAKKSDLSYNISEKQSPGFSKILSHATISCTDVEQAIENEEKSCSSLQVKKEQVNRPENAFSNTASLDEQNRNEADNLSESLQNAQKQNRKEDESAVNMVSNMLQDQDNGCISKADPDIDTSLAAKKMKISDSTLSNKLKRKGQFDSLPKKKICLTDLSHQLQKNANSATVQANQPDIDTSLAAKKMKISDSTLSNKLKRKGQFDSLPKKNICLMDLSHQLQKNANSATVQANQPDKTSETMPLLYSILKLRKTKDNILLEMNCPPEGNRETMHQVFQLFKNEFS